MGILSDGADATGIRVGNYYAGTLKRKTRCYKTFRINEYNPLYFSVTVHFSDLNFWKAISMPRSNVSPVDGCLYTDGISVEPHHKEAWKNEKTAFNQLRGEVLSTVVEIESMIEYAIADCLLPSRRSVRSPSWLHDRHGLFQEEVMSRFDLNTKVDLLISLMRRRFPRWQKDVDELKSCLESVRKTRNIFAHAPVVFEGLQKTSNGRWLRVWLETKNDRVHISVGYILELKKKTSLAMELLNKILSRGLKVQKLHIE